MHVFISHSTEDELEVSALVDRLKDALPGCPFFVSSFGDIKPGDEWWNSIQRALRDAVVVMVVLSPRSLDRPWLFFEGGAAWAMGIPVIPVLVAGLSSGGVPPPMSAFQHVAEEEGFELLVARLSELTRLPPRTRRAQRRSHSPATAVAGSDQVGVHLDNRWLPLNVGWVRYDGTVELITTPRYIDTGSSFDNGYRFPPQDTLRTRAERIGVRLMCLRNVHFYAVCTLTSGRSIKLYLSTLHRDWGFSGTPTDEFRVPLPALRSRCWHMIVLDLQSFERPLGAAIRSIDGLRVRGGVRLSHVWCVSHGVQLRPVHQRDALTEIAWPT